MPPTLSPAGAPPRAAEPKDFSHLLRPEIYHPLSQLSVPPPFRNSAKQPTPDTPIAELLARGHYRAAAIAAAQELTGGGSALPPDPTDHARILDLLHVRLACLTLSAATSGAAAQEARALGDPSASLYYHSDPDPDSTDGDGATTTTGGRHHLAPWPLRVLVVRLQAAGFADPRRAVMSYYDLAGEARAHVAEAARAGDNSARELWRGRLAELGVRVAGALVEMDDLVGAAQHLRTLRDSGDGKLGVAKALLWLHLGDVEAARGCVRPGEVGGTMIAALCAMADGLYEEGLLLWRELKEEGVDDEMIGVNTAVCLLYLGRMQEVCPPSPCFYDVLLTTSIGQVPLRGPS